MSRIRQATRVELPTSGHLLSHNPAEIRAALESADLSQVLVLDDTSFSGNTSLIFENLLKEAFPERQIAFTHAFLILNSGNLGPHPGAKKSLESVGSRALGGREMSTPKDDGWHFFDLVKQADLTNHLLVVKELINLCCQPNFSALAAALLSDESTLRLVSPQIFSTQDLEQKRQTGHFVGDQRLNGDFHVRNPQLLPNIVGQGHLRPISQWQGQPEDSLSLLVELGELLQEGGQ